MRIREPILILLIVLLSGCGKAPAPKYSRLRTQLVQNALNNLNKGEPQDNIQQLQRLQDLCPEEPFYKLALARERERFAWQELNKIFYNGKIGSISEWKQKYLDAGLDVLLLQQVESFLETARVLEKYQAQTPFTTSQQAQKALQQVQKQGEMFVSTSAFRHWVQIQEQHIQALQTEEYRAELEKLLEQYDRALFTGSEDIGRIEKKLSSFAPEHLLTRMVKMKNKSDWAGIEHLLSESISSLPQGLRSFELAVFQSWNVVSPDLKLQLVKELQNNDASFLCGRWISIRRAAEKQDWARAKTEVAALVAITVPANDLVTDLLTETVMSKEKFLAKCWCAPFPAITDILNCIAQVRMETRKKDSLE